MRETVCAPSIVGAIVVACIAGAAFGQGTVGSAQQTTHALFHRVASFPVFLNTSEDAETIAEIVTSARDGNLLVYTDSLTRNLGFVDITDPSHPTPAGVVAMPGEPTSVAALGDYALAVVNTSTDYVNTSGVLQVIDIDSRQVVRSIELGGQPDAIAISSDQRYAAIAIENERNEEFNDGEPPQLPAGYVVIVDLVGGPADWATREVNLEGVADLYPEDPEPEFVDISEDNILAVSLQENNHIVLIDLATGEIVHDFPAGSVNLKKIDTEEDGVIDQSGSLRDIPREPDAIAWVSGGAFATADEGDLFGGSRGFTIFGVWGAPLYESGPEVEHEAARIGHYPEDRSENKGTEPEGVEFARFGNDDLLFVGSERSNTVLVYKLVGAQRRPQFVQALPAGVGPEGLHAIPGRDLFVVANETDARGDAYRATIMIYQRGEGAAYPDIRSANHTGGVPIAWAALSGLAADANDAHTIYTIHDNYYGVSRIYAMQVHKHPAVIRRSTRLVDASGALLDSLTALKADLPGTDGFDPQTFVNDDLTVNLDLEGIETLADGRFLVASEGGGNLVDGVSNPDDQPFQSPNLIAIADSHGGIESVVLPPLELTRNQSRYGLEGVAFADDAVYVAFQRAWADAGDPAEFARIGRYDLATGEWGFAYYPLDEATSPNGGWVGLSEITSLGNGGFALLERDNQGGTDARVKRVYTISVDGVDFRPHSDAPNLVVLDKQLTRDMIAEGDFHAIAGPIPEKLEGLTVVDGEILIVNDNDGVEDNSGETRLFRIKP